MIWQNVAAAIGRKPLSAMLVKTSPKVAKQTGGAVIGLESPLSQERNLD